MTLSWHMEPAEWLQDKICYALFIYFFTIVLTMGHLQKAETFQIFVVPGSSSISFVYQIVYLYTHVWMWESDCEEGWAPKNWCFWSVVLEKTLESPLDCKEIQPVHSEGDQPWVFFGRNDAKAETPVL